MKIAFICTNYNNSEQTVKAVESIQLNMPHECRSIVVDNQSSAGQTEILRELSGRVESLDVIYNGKNVGYFSGLNIGLAHLRSNYPDISFAIIGNNDLVFPLEFISSIERISEKFDKYPVISPNIVTIDGIHQNPHVISKISNFRERVYDVYYKNYYVALLIKWFTKFAQSMVRRGDEDQHEYAQEIWQGHGSCYLVGPKFFSNFRELWAPTLLFGEEFFLSKQLSDKGFKLYYEPSVQLIHAYHSAVGNLPKRRHWELARQAHDIYRKYNPIGH